MTYLQRFWRKINWRTVGIEVGLPLFLFTLISLAVSWPLARDFSTKLISNGGDARNNLWQLWHVKEFFLGNSPTIKEIVPWWPCKTAGALGVTRAVTYRMDLEALWFYMPQEFQPMAPQLRGLEYIVPCTADFGGVHVRLPKSITYADGI